MVRTALACTLALLSLPTVAFAEGTNGGPGWEYVKTDRDVEVYRKEVPGSGVVAFKGVTTANLPIGQLLAVFNDPSERKNWVDRYAEHVTIEKGQYQELYWIHFGLPWPVSDRDYVLEAKGIADEATRTFKVKIKSVTSPKKGEDDCCVRATAIGTYYEFTALPGAKKTKIVVEVHTDPKGALPNWLVNLIQKSWPSKTLGGLVEHTAKIKKAPLPEFANWHDKELPVAKVEEKPAETPTPVDAAPAPAPAPATP